MFYDSILRRTRHCLVSREYLVSDTLGTLSALLKKSHPCQWDLHYLHLCFWEGLLHLCMVLSFGPNCCFYCSYGCFFHIPKTHRVQPSTVHTTKYILLSIHTFYRGWEGALKSHFHLFQQAPILRSSSWENTKSYTSGRPRQYRDNGTSTSNFITEIMLYTGAWMRRCHLL
jgi:hypothetical protein